MLRVHYKKKLKNVSFKSGNIYTFGYQAWENDPKPVIIYMYAFSGTHPRTGREWRFIQAINFTYVPRAQRRLFITTWQSIVGNISTFRRGNLRFTWDQVLRKYPYLKPAVRRYFYTPSYYIKTPQEIPFADWEKAVVSTMTKDFSKKVKASLINKFRNVLGRRKTNKGGFKSIFGGKI